MRHIWISGEGVQYSMSEVQFLAKLLGDDILFQSPMEPGRHKLVIMEATKRDKQILFSKS